MQKQSPMMTDEKYFFGTNDVCLSRKIRELKRIKTVKQKRELYMYRLGRKTRQCKGNEWVGEKDVQFFFIFAFFNLTPPPLRAYSLISFP